MSRSDHPRHPGVLGVFAIFWLPTFRTPQKLCTAECRAQLYTPAIEPNYMTSSSANPSYSTSTHSNQLKTSTTNLREPNNCNNSNLPTHYPHTSTNSHPMYPTHSNKQQRLRLSSIGLSPSSSLISIDQHTHPILVHFFSQRFLWVG
jgi:hypothetical protein